MGEPSAAPAEEGAAAEGEEDEEDDYAEIQHAVKLDLAVVQLVSMVNDLGFGGLNASIDNLVAQLSALSATQLGDWSGWMSLLCSIRCAMQQLEDIAKAVMLGSATPRGGCSD